MARGKQPATAYHRTNDRVADRSCLPVNSCFPLANSHMYECCLYEHVLCALLMVEISMYKCKIVNEQLSHECVRVIVVAFISYRPLLWLYFNIMICIVFIHFLICNYWNNSSYPCLWYTRLRNVLHTVHTASSFDLNFFFIHSSYDLASLYAYKYFKRYGIEAEGI